MRRAATPILSAIALGCSAQVAEPPRTATTYQGAARAVFERNCLECHAKDGIGPFPLDDYASAKKALGAVVAAVEDGRMPPWLPDPQCRHYLDERVMPAEDKQALRAWMESGAPEGDIAEYRAPQRAAPSVVLPAAPPDLSLGSPVAYTPDAAKVDDYRCFPLDVRFDRETFIGAARIVPDQKAIVHHVLVYVIPPGFGDRVDALDAAEAGPGYTCFGGPGVGSPQVISGWAPGGVPNVLPENAAIRIAEGARLVMQVHYNTLNAPGVADGSRLELWYRAEQPPYLVVLKPIANLGIDIAAGDPASKQTAVVKNTSGKTWTIVGNAVHMHLLGRRQRLTALHEDGQELCLVDVPRWSFHWQQPYRFRQGEEVTLRHGESLKIECTYDNSAANQPIVGGARRTPQRVLWGEGTTDEMCLNFVITVEPYAPVPPPQDRCPGFQACYDACRASGMLPMTGCALRCASATSGTCVECVLQSLVPCVLNDCPETTGAMVSCLTRCASMPGTDSCAASQCGGDIVSFDACAAPIVRTSQCDNALAACAVKL